MRDLRGPNLAKRRSLNQGRLPSEPNEIKWIRDQEGTVLAGSVHASRVEQYETGMARSRALPVQAHSDGTVAIQASGSGVELGILESREFSFLVML